MTNTIRILANDPGTKSYGIAVIEVKLPKPLTKEQQRPKNNNQPLKSLPFRVLHTRKLKHCYTNLKNASVIGSETIEYIKEISQLVVEYDVDFIIAERYQSRRMGGTTIELVNMMLGTLRGIAHVKNTPLKVMPASQWKVPLKNKEFDLEALYKEAKVFKVSDHEVDACFIGLYGAFTLTRRKPFFMTNVQSLGSGVLRDLKKLTKEKQVNK